MLRGGFVHKARCPKCGGNVYLDTDFYGWVEQCLQCGYTRNLDNVKPDVVETGDKCMAKPVKEPAKID